MDRKHPKYLRRTLLFVVLTLKNFLKTIIIGIHRYGVKRSLDILLNGYFLSTIKPYIPCFNIFFKKYLIIQNLDLKK